MEILVFARFSPDNGAHHFVSRASFVESKYANHHFTSSVAAAPISRRPRVIRERASCAGRRVRPKSLLLRYLIPKSRCHFSISDTKKSRSAKLVVQNLNASHPLLASVSSLSSSLSALRIIIAAHHFCISSTI